MSYVMRRFVAAAMTALAVTSFAGCSTGPDEETTAVIEQIESLGTITEESGPSLNQAEAAYRALDDKQKEKVENYDTLTAARDEYDGIRAEQVVEMIDAIGEVTLDKADQIGEAGDKYSSLTGDQKKKVGNAQVLENAKTQLKEMQEQFSVGDTVTTNNWKATLTNAYVSSKLESSESRTYWEPQSGGAFLILEFDLEHLNSGNGTIDGEALADIVASYNGNTYSSWYYQYVDLELWLYGDGHTMDANMPTHFYVYTQIPSSSLDDGQAITVRLTIDGQEKKISVR